MFAVANSFIFPIFPHTKRKILITTPNHSSLLQVARGWAWLILPATLCLLTLIFPFATYNCTTRRIVSVNLGIRCPLDRYDTPTLLIVADCHTTSLTGRECCSRTHSTAMHVVHKQASAGVAEKQKSNSAGHVAIPPWTGEPVLPRLVAASIRGFSSSGQNTSF